MCNQSSKFLKCGKASGPDDIRNEYIKYEKQNLKLVLNQLFNMIYDIDIYPVNWSTGVIVPIYKKGDMDNPANYRGITLKCAMSKLFTFMLNRRINEWPKKFNILSQAQFAYKPGYSTTDAIFVLHAVLSSSLESFTYKGACYVSSISLRRLIRLTETFLKKGLKQFHISAKLLNMIKNMYSKLKCQVRISVGESDHFAQDNGVMQGECLSPTLFAAYINKIVRLMNNIE